MIIDEKVYLEHHGIKGMRWGVRNDSRIPGISRSVNRDARKDAKEFAAAKLFFGEGAGTRRKLIKNTVEAKSKRNSDYSKAFKKHLDSQDLSKHASNAVSKRKSIDRRDRAKKQAGFLARHFTGEMGTQAAFVAAALAGAAYLKSDNGQRLMFKSGAKLKDILNSVAQKKGAMHINRLLKDLA